MGGGISISGRERVTFVRWTHINGIGVRGPTTQAYNQGEVDTTIRNVDVGCPGDRERAADGVGRMVVVGERERERESAREREFDRCDSFSVSWHPEWRIAAADRGGGGGDSQSDRPYIRRLFHSLELLV